MVVYRIRNRMTGQSYIGATTKALHTRVSHHKAMAARGLKRPLADAIREYGWEAFDVEELSRCSSKSQMYEREQQCIAIFNTMAPHGYNMTIGGTAISVRSEETREKLRRALKAHPMPKPSPEAFRHGAEKRRGAANCRARAIEYRGVVYQAISEAVAATGLSRSQMNRRLANGAAQFVGYARVAPPVGHWNKGRKHTPEAVAKISATRKGAKNWNARQVEIAGTVYACLDEAATANGLSRGQVYRRIKRGTARFLTDRKHAT